MRIPQFVRGAWMSAAVVFLVVGAAALAGPLRRAWAARSLATDRAEWIWCDTRSPLALGPVAFFAVRDFALHEQPKGATLLIQADEEYVAYLNGHPVGANRYAPGAPLDVYDLGGLLRGGGNRLQVEVRSARGTGGLLASVDVSGLGRALFATGPEWKLFRRGRPGLFEGWLLASAGDPMQSWGMPPVGRWSAPRPGPVRKPELEEAEDLAAPVRARVLDPSAAWRDVVPGSDLPPAREGLILLDWGRAVSGYLRLEMNGAGGGAALLFGGPTPPDPRLRPSDGVVVSPPGAYLWRDPQARSFRYLLVAGLTDLSRAEVSRAPAAAGGAPSRGVFGLEPPPLRTPAEDELRRKLKGFAGVAFGEVG